MSEKVIELSVVIPVFNQEKTVVELYFRLTKSLEGLKKDYEIIFVDDGSRDRTYELLRELHQKDERVRIVKLLKNFGQHPALIAGFHQVKGQVIVSLNGDLQDPPEVIPEFLAKIEEGYHVVGGYRKLKAISWPQRAIIKLTNWLLSKLTRVPLRDYGCLLRAYKKSVIDMLLQCRERSSTINPLASWLGVSIQELPISQSSTKTEGFFRLIVSSFNLLTSFSSSAIQSVSLIGVVLGLISFGAGICLLIWGGICGAGQGGMVIFTGLFFILFSLQLAGTGLVCRYLGQIYVQTQGRPYYIIEEIIE